MTRTRPHRKEEPRPMKLSCLTGTACAVLLLASLTACGGDDDSATDAGAAAAAAPADRGGPGGAGMPGGPGASGLVAAVSGRTMQVQSAGSGQVAVTWTAETAFLEQVAGSSADVTVGTCVLVTADGGTEDGEPVAADAVRITEAAEDGGCTGGSGGGPGGGPGGERPEGMPTDRPTDRPAGFGGTAGKVTAVSTTGFTVESAEVDVEVTVDAETTYSTTAEADAAAAEVGRCVTAVGEADDTGAVTATRINVSDPVDGECSAGRGFGGPPARGEDS